MDLRGGPEDFDEAEYSEAGAVLVAAAGKLVGSCRMGWRLPWGVRVRVCESLLAGMYFGAGKCGDSGKCGGATTFSINHGSS